jgi:DUF971 family protein
MYSDSNTGIYSWTILAKDEKKKDEKRKPRKEEYIREQQVSETSRRKQVRGT